MYCLYVNKMEVIALVFSTLLLTGTTQGLQCWECESSTTSSECRDSSFSGESPGLKKVDCNPTVSTFHSTFSISTGKTDPGTLCKKEVVNKRSLGEDVVLTFRGCGNSMDIRIGCETKRTIKNETLETCFCSGDFCNGAYSRKDMSLRVGILSTLFLIYFLLC